jgi:hypothetical protein
MSAAGNSYIKPGIYKTLTKISPQNPSLDQPILSTGSPDAAEAALQIQTLWRFR